MAQTKPTIFQRLNLLFGNGQTVNQQYQEKVNKYNINGDTVIFKTRNKEEYENEKATLKQQHLLAHQWVRAQYDVANRALAGLTDVKIMYRDADLMDLFPEIGAGLDVLCEEATFTPSKGYMVDVTSKSERVKSIIQDLLYNKLSIHMMLPMICRSMCKYGNTFMLLNIDKEGGVLGWRQLPVYEMERYENGMDNPYENAFKPKTNIDVDADDSVKFVWVGQNEFIPYMNWQIAHFRLLYDSIYMPYGVSALNKARRHFRMLSMAEDMMLIYRLDRSIERRVFKINVGSIDEADVPAFVNQIADNFKRTEIIDPLTGQLDLRKNIMTQTDDFFVPVRDDSAANPIEVLPAGNNLTAMDDIKYLQNKVFTAMRVPKPFLNFEEAQQGDGKNASMLDVRFMRTVNKIQQMMLLELNKICIIHLYLLGFYDDLTNFSLSMHNPSSVAEQLEIENLSKKIATAKDAVTDPGGGIPVMSMTRAWKEILGWSAKEIEENLNELRLERALAGELALTPQIIQRTGLFDDVDNIYGEPGAQYNFNQQAAGGLDGGMGGGFGGGGFGGSLGGDLGSGMDMGGDLSAGMDMMGAEGEMGIGAAADENNALAGGGPEQAPSGNEPTASGVGNEPLLEELVNKKYFSKMLDEQKKFNTPTFNERAKKYREMYKQKLEEFKNESLETLYDKQKAINQEYFDLTKRLDEYINSDLEE